MAFNLRPRQRTDYQFLNSGENVKFENAIIKINPVIEETYFIDRLIWRRKDKERCVSITLSVFFLSFFLIWVCIFAFLFRTFISYHTAEIRKTLLRTEFSNGFSWFSRKNKAKIKWSFGSFNCLSRFIHAHDKLSRLLCWNVTP